MGWLKSHLETFVEPVLGFIPNYLAPYRIFTPQDMAAIKGMWRNIKRETIKSGLPLLLPGRDVFVFEILARRENFPTVFRPDISRLTVNNVIEDYSSHFVFDTGFMGSIPRDLRCPSFKMASSCEITRPRQALSKDTIQVFPRMAGARSLALKIENTPKYWRRGFVRDGKIGQDYADLSEFLKAAYLTIEVYTDSSPAFVENREAIDFSQNYPAW